LLKIVVFKRNKAHAQDLFVEEMPVLQQKDDRSRR
jgi:hypothetical protein